MLASNHQCMRNSAGEIFIVDGIGRDFEYREGSVSIMAAQYAALSRQRRRYARVIQGGRRRSADALWPIRR